MMESNTSLDNLPSIDFSSFSISKHPVYQQIFISIFLWGAQIITISGNSLVFLAFARDVGLRAKVGNLFILNLTIADILVGLNSFTFSNISVPERCPPGPSVIVANNHYNQVDEHGKYRHVQVRDSSITTQDMNTTEESSKRNHLRESTEVTEDVSKDNQQESTEESLRSNQRESSKKLSKGNWRKLSTEDVSKGNQRESSKHSSKSNQRVSTKNSSKGNWRESTDDVSQSNRRESAKNSSKCNQQKSTNDSSKDNQGDSAKDSSKGYQRETTKDSSNDNQPESSKDHQGSANLILKRDRKAAFMLALIVVTFWICWLSFSFVHVITVVYEQVLKRSYTISQLTWNVAYYMLLLNSAINPGF